MALVWDRKPMMIVTLCVAFVMPVWISAYHLGIHALPEPVYFQ